MRIPRTFGEARDKVALRLARTRQSTEIGRELDARWRSFEGLTPFSTALVGIRPAGDRRPHVNVLLPEIGPSSYFAGVRTALLVAALTARSLGRPLRVVSFGLLPRRSETRWLADMIQSDLHIELETVSLLSVWSIGEERISREDVWVATYWTTAHALDVASRSGLISPDQVIYLLQDYEAGFFAGSSTSAVVQSTYHAGFKPLVNSQPVATMLERREGLEFSADQVFAPRIDLGRLQNASLLERSAGPLRVGFYGRPSKPRNAFALGVAALRSTSARLDRPTDDVEFWSMGEKHSDVPLPGGRRVRSIGKVSWNSYFERLASFDVLLSLQQSPHPSHPPLDMVALGGFAVTNDFEGTRSAVAHRLVATANDPDALADGLLEVLKEPTLRARRTFDDQIVHALGVPLERAVDAVSDSLQ